MSRFCYGWIPQEQLSNNQNADQAIKLILEPYLAAPFFNKFAKKNKPSPSCCTKFWWMKKHKYEKGLLI